MKNASIFRVGGKMKVDVPKLVHLTGKKYGEHIFKNHKSLHIKFFFLGFRLSDTI